ncbi:DUF3067 family protein [Halorubrum sp. GN11_10-6_MGM]|uniref:DUF3067 family protein n=1 Tax=Halorubrum sp. GN11_10-6_MGM TaxID=2518112 RepID=UPI001F542017|nr:DUF3067 family protein [Halorubrum sp. GN11_10-6_MGM]
MPNGMKSGAGDDPFADDDDQEDNVDKDSANPALEPHHEDLHEETGEPDSTTAMPGVPDHPGDVEATLPWIHRRDGVKDDRDHKTIHYTEHTVKRERRELRPALEERLGDDVELTDAREAAYLVGMEHLDEVANVLREWGYDIE